MSMTKEEAIEHMNNGGKVRHPWFTPSEFIYMKKESVYDESDMKLGSLNHFFMYRTAEGFNTDWEIAD
jgi:hypothetical protein